MNKSMSVELAVGVVALSLCACGSVGTSAAGENGGDGGSAAISDGGTGPDFDECAEVFETARNLRAPADVLVAIDNTPSMYNEIEEVRVNLNRLSERVRAEGLNLRVALISCLTAECTGNHGNWHTICVDAPLGLGSCPEEDTNPPDYFHVNHRIESLKALENIVDTHAEWAPQLRDGAAKHIVVISDDGDELTASQFSAALIAAEPRMADHQFHGIYSYSSKEDACESGDDPCCQYAAPGGEGTVYRELVEVTGGVSVGDLCLQDFDPVFDALASAVIESSALSCEWEIPAPPAGEVLDPGLVNVEFVDDSGTAQRIGQISNAGLCASAAQGWYYDDPVAPTTVHVCPQTCTWIQGHEGAEMRIYFGCETEIEPVD